MLAEGSGGGHGNCGNGHDVPVLVATIGMLVGLGVGVGTSAGVPVARGAQLDKKMPKDMPIAIILTTDHNLGFCMLFPSCLSSNGVSLEISGCLSLCHHATSI